MTENRPKSTPVRSISCNIDIPDLKRLSRKALLKGALTLTIAALRSLQTLALHSHRRFLALHQNFSFDHLVGPAMCFATADGACRSSGQKQLVWNKSARIRRMMQSARRDVQSSAPRNGEASLPRLRRCRRGAVNKVLAYLVPREQKQIARLRTDILPNRT